MRTMPDGTEQHEHIYRDHEEGAWAWRRGMGIRHVLLESGEKPCRQRPGQADDQRQKDADAA